MPNSQNLTQLARWMAGDYNNQAQAIDQPVWFVHLRLWYRPLPHRLEGHLALFAEQANVLQLDRPYRQRVVILQETGETQRLQAQYLALKHPEQFRGAGANPSLLTDLHLADLDYLPGCTLNVVLQDGVFVGELEPGSTCCFAYEGQTRQVILGFAISENRLLSYDRGVDPETGSALWGAIMGPYEFHKYHDFGAELSLD